MKKKALITGVTGQDGAYLAEFLLNRGYEVHGIKRRTSLFNTDRIDHLYQGPHEKDRRFILHYGDMTDSSSLIRIVQQVQPDEIYNLAAQSHVAVSFEEPEYTADSDALGVLRLIEAIRILGLEKEDPLLPGIHLGVVWQGPGNPAARDHAVSPSFPIRGCQTLCPLDHRQLSGGLWVIRLQRHSVQSRITPPRRDFCYAQDYARTEPHPAGIAGLSLPRESGCEA